MESIDQEPGVWLFDRSEAIARDSLDTSRDTLVSRLRDKGAKTTKR
jgi:hypothetical protein